MCVIARESVGRKLDVVVISRRRLGDHFTEHYFGDLSDILISSVLITLLAIPRIIMQLAPRQSNICKSEK